jgi:hypothetical protein
MECAAPEDRIPRKTHGYTPPTPPSSCSTRRGWRDAPPGCPRATAVRTGVLGVLTLGHFRPPLLAWRDAPAGCPRATAVPHSCTSTRWRGSRTSSRSCAPMARASRWCTRARITSSWCRPLSFGRKPVRFPKAAGRQERAGGCRGGGGMGIGMQGSAHADVADVGLQDLSSSSLVEHKTRGRGRHGMAWHMQSSRPAQLPCHVGLPRDRPLAMRTLCAFGREPPARFRARLHRRPHGIPCGTVPPPLVRGRVRFHLMSKKGSRFRRKTVHSLGQARLTHPYPAWV